MPARIRFWVLGLVVGSILGSVVPESIFPGIKPIVLGLTFLIIGLIAETYLNCLERSRQTSSHPRNHREADGRVEVASLSGVQNTPNTLDARFGVYVGLVDHDSRSIATSDLFRPASRRSPSLIGRVLMVSIFVGRDGRSWSDGEIAEAHSELHRAAVWIERQAIRHKAAVNLELSGTYFRFNDDSDDEVALAFIHEGDDIGPLEDRATTKALVIASRTAAQHGFQDASDFFQGIAARTSADALVWLIHPRQAGRSFALPLEDSDLWGVSLAVCYPREASFPEALRGAARPDPVTIVHEFLHLFGATDKYGRDLREYPRGLVTRREIMRLSETRLSRLQIDELTALEMGWTH